MNLSSIPVTDDAVQVLSKGLSFAPTHQTMEFKTKIDLFRFHRNLQLRAWYGQTTQIPSNMSREHQEPSRDPSKFKPKSFFLPPIQNLTINTFIKKVNYDVELLFKKDVKPLKRNLTKKEQDVLISLSDNKDLVIKPADKGGDVVIWSRHLYIQ